jgi:hypothetical protein
VIVGKSWDKGWKSSCVMEVENEAHLRKECIKLASPISTLLHISL